MRSRTERTTYVWTVQQGGEVVGRAVVDVPHDAGSRVVIATIEMLPRVWGQGIGTAVLPHVEAIARDHGRSVIQNWTEQQASGGPRIEAPTGFGSVPRDHVARFLQHSGFGLEQVYRVSHLALSARIDAHVDALLSDARAASAGYRLVQWTTPTPAARIDDYAWLKSRMSTDAPSAGLDTDEEKWDARRVIEMEERVAQMGQTLLVVAAEHIETGRLSAFTELGIGSDHTATTHQNDTLVLKEHRGHRLGMVLKCEALRLWRDLMPESTRVITYNAEENRPMLSINEAIGFHAIAYEGAWKKELR
ncbi:GNAT family N-acetyltransferase [Microbacterium saperdae]